MTSPGTGLLAATQFLTRIPIRLRQAPDLAASVPWFGVVGAGLGASLGALAAALMQVVPASVAAAVTVVCGVMITGAFHEDGLADTADALGGMTPDRRREILKDSRHGSYGVAAMCSTIVIRIVALATLSPAAAVASLVAAHSLGRSAAVGVMAVTGPAAPVGLGADFIRRLSRPGAIIGVMGGVLLTAATTGWWIGPFVATAGIAAASVAVGARRAFGGIGGDHLGAVEQVVECSVLVVASGLALESSPWWT